MSYSSDQVTAALQTLIAKRGNAEAAAAELGIPASTLRTWRGDTYAEQYRRLEEAFNHELIDETKALARENAHKASDLESRLLKKVEDSIEKMDGKDAALAAEKVASVKAKSIDKLISLTAHDAGRQDRKTDFGGLLDSMEREGYIRVVGRPAPAEDDVDEGES